MGNCYLTRVLSVFLTLTLSAMTNPVSSQNIPGYDNLTTSAGVVEMHFIGHGSLMFKLNSFVIYVDPVRSVGSYDNLPKADLILVTHEHGDHLDTKLIEDLKKDGTVLFGNEGSAAKVPWGKAVKAGDKKDVSMFGIEVVPAYNIVNENSPGKPFHPKGVGVGYVISVGGKRIYVAGDTENTPEMKALKNIDVAFLPMNLPYTMNPAMVADAALAFKPKILYPYHFGETNTNELIKLLNNSSIDVRIRNLK
jgi:L-ascorbate metabolism protein UlaG (beta-lactamase superfamily)